MQGCLIPKIETTTFVGDDGTVRFHMDAMVQVTGDVDAIAAQLNGIGTANEDLDLTFDSA